MVLLKCIRYYVQIVFNIMQSISINYRYCIIIYYIKETLRCVESSNFNNFPSFFFKNISLFLLSILYNILFLICTAYYSSRIVIYLYHYPIDYNIIVYKCLSTKLIQQVVVDLFTPPREGLCRS